MAISFKQGKYTGDGANSKAITGVGFKPKVLFIWADNYTGWQSAIWKTDQMATGSTGANANFGENGLETGGKIASLDADGFTVGHASITTGNRDAVNKNGQVYYYVAIAGTSCKTGSFAGNGSDNRGITGVGFQAELILIQCGNNHTMFKTKASGVSTDISSYTSGPSLAATSNKIQSIDSDGFTVGSGNEVNQSGNTVHYVAFETIAGVKTGQYTGNATDNRNITGVGFQPEFVLIKNEGGGATQPEDDACAQTEQHNIDAGDSTMCSRTQNSFADGIQDLISDGFQVGAGNPVNENSITFNWFAFGQGATNVTVSPSALSATFSVPASTQSGGANVAPAVQAATFSVPASAVSGGATIASSVLSAVFSIPTVNIITPDAQILATVLTATFSLPTATPSGGASVDATVQSATFSIPAVSFIGSVSITPDAQVATFTTLAPTISAIGNVTVSATAVAATFSLQSPTVTAEQNAMFNAGVLSATFSVQAPTITAIRNVTIDASVISATFSIPTPLRKVGGLWTPQPRAQGVWTPQPRII